MSAFQTIVADPPWPYESTGSHLQTDCENGRNKADGRGPNLSSIQRYGSMTMDQLKALNVKGVVAKHAHLYLWTTNAFMVEAHDLARAWGFTPKTILTWTKIKQDGSGLPSMKTGYYFRGATEHVVFCVRGSLRLLTTRGLSTAILAPRLAHSVKPEAFYTMVEEASPAPRLEMFARRARDGWSTWGNELPTDVVL